MKLVNLLLLFGLFGLMCKIIDANQIVDKVERVSFSVVKVWQGYHKKSRSCPVEDAPWKNGVEGVYNGCRGAIDKFGDTAKEVGDVAIRSLGEYLDKLICFTDSNSTIVTTCSTAILSSLSKCIHMNRDGLNLMVEFNKVFLPIIEDFATTVESLSDHIGDLTGSLTDSLRDLGREFSKYMTAFLDSCRLFGCRTKIDYECVQKKLQKLMNIVALINETLLTKCKTADQEVYEAVVILDLIYGYLALSVQGIYSCSLDALNARDITVPESLKSSSLSFEYALVQVIQAISAVTLPLSNSVTSLLTAFVNITVALNSMLK